MSHFSPATLIVYAWLLEPLTNVDYCLDFAIGMTACAKFGVVRHQLVLTRPQEKMSAERKTTGQLSPRCVISVIESQKRTGTCSMISGSTQ